MSEAAYLDLLKTVLEQGKERKDRTGVGTRGLFGGQLRFDLREGFPLLTTKKVHLKSIIHELLWFLRGETDVRSLQEAGVTIWDEWATEEQTRALRPQGRRLGPGVRPPVAQLRGHARAPTAPTSETASTRSRAWCATSARARQPPPARHRLEPARGRPGGAAAVPHALPVPRAGRRAVVPALPAQRRRLPRRALQHRELRAAHDDGRAGDGHAPGDFVHTFGDVHLYENHVEQAKQQLVARAARRSPAMRLNPAVKDLFAFRYEDFTLEGYDPHPAIKAPVAV